MSRHITKIERDALRKARKNQGLTQLDLADLMGVNQSVISRIESGDIQISERLWQSVIEKYGVNLEKQSPIELLNIYQEDAEMVRLLVEEYGSQIPDTAIKAIRTYVEHIIGLSVGDRFIEGAPPVPVQSLWGSDWSWGPRELERFITPECARTLNWSHLLIHRNYPILIGGKEIDKTEIYIDGYGEGKSDSPTFFDQIDREGVYTEADLKTSKDKSQGTSTYLNQYLRNVISVRVSLPGVPRRYVNVLMSGDSEFSLADYNFLDSLVRQFLQQRGELNYDRGQLLSRSES